VVSGGSHARKATASLANVIDAVRDRYSEVNIVIAPGLGNLPISDLKLRTSSISEELEAIRVASGGKFECSGGSGNGAVDPTTGLPIVSGFKNQGLFTLREPTAPENQRVVEAFNIGPYLQSAGEDEENSTPDKPGHLGDKKESKELRDRRSNERLEQLKKIILETISALHPNSTEQPNFQFHHGANLLVIIGSRDTLDVSRKVVNAMPGQSLLAIAPSGPPETGISAAERERFLQRYGIMPNKSPGQGQMNPELQEQFRRRYGLDRPPGPQPGTAPAQKPQP